MTKPVAGVEVGLVDGVLTVNPSKQEMARSPLQLTLAGTKEGILMIEGASDFLSEEIMVDALRLGHKVTKPFVFFSSILFYGIKSIIVHMFGRMMSRLSARSVMA